jgi:hypothetical protein
MSATPAAAGATRKAAALPPASAARPATACAAAVPIGPPALTAIRAVAVPRPPDRRSVRAYAEIMYGAMEKPVTVMATGSDA